MKILLVGFSAEVGEEDILKPRTGNGIHKINNDHGAGMVNFIKKTFAITGHGGQ
jgi:hypothetical protein